MSDMTHKTVPVEPTAVDLLIKAMRFGYPLKNNDAYKKLKSMLEAAPPSPVTELEVMLAKALRAFRDGGPDGGTNFNGWHQSYEEPCRLAIEALAAYEAKKGK